MSDINIKDIQQAYLAAALWTEQEELGDADQFSLSDEAREHLRAEVEKFVQLAGEHLHTYIEKMRSEEWSGEARAGHDLWLTRNGHGTGFWDRGLGDLGDRLTEVARGMGNSDLYVGDDGLLYFQ